MPTSRWSAERWFGAITTVVAILGLGGMFLVPEVRQWTRIETAKASNTPSPGRSPVDAKEKTTSTSGGTIREVAELKSTGIARQAPHQGSIAAIQRNEIVIDEQGRRLPDIVAAADDALNTLRSQLYVVRGHLRSSQSHADDGLQGLITTDLVLDVKLIDSRGEILNAFTITGRGGGFTNDSSAFQARRRLIEALREQLQKERM